MAFKPTVCTKMAAFDNAVCRAIQVFGIEKLKPVQEDILRSLINGEDCMAVLPTGYGKSLPHQLYSLVRSYMDPSTVHRVIVCCPLLSLMEDQVNRMRSVEIKAAYKGKDAESDAAIQSGEINVVFASPESLLAGEWIRQLRNVSLIVIDEFHTIATWGGMEHEDEEKVFRKWFRHVGELRSYFPDASLLALSATCTNHIKKRVTDLCSFNPQKTRFFEVSPNRSNIKIIVKKTSHELSECFYWLIEKIFELQDKLPRVIIYCNSIEDVSKVYFYIKNEIEDYGDLLDMFHSETPGIKKQKIVQDLSRVSKLRVVIATSALGMGVDIKDCNSIILFGAPMNVVDLLQEIGRCGRDGKNSVAIILYNRYQLRNVSSEVREILTSNICRRVNTLKHFQKQTDCNSILHSCCDICEPSCTCGVCVQLPYEKYMCNFQSITSQESNDESDESSNTISCESDLDEV